MLFQAEQLCLYVINILIFCNFLKSIRGSTFFNFWEQHFKLIVPIPPPSESFTSPLKYGDFRDSPELFGVLFPTQSLCSQWPG